MKKNSVIVNYLYTVGYNLISMFIPLITTPYIARVLSAEGVGFVSYSKSIVTYFILFSSIGIQLYGQREIAYFQSSPSERTKIFKELLAIKFFMVSICSVIYICFCFSTSSKVLKRLLLVQLIDIIGNFFDISWYFQGIEQFKKLVLRNFVIKFTGLVFIFIFVKSIEDLYKYVFIISLSAFIGNLLMWFYLPKYSVNGKVRIKILKHIKPLIILFVPQVAIQIYGILDKTMLGYMTNISEVGYYEQAQHLCKVALSLVTALGTVMLPRMSFLYSKKDTSASLYIEKSIHFTTCFSMAIMFGVISIANRFIPLYLGNGFEKSISIMITISPIIVFIAFSNVFGIQILVPQKKQREYTISVIAGAAINVILNCILIKSMGGIGAAIATVIAEATVTIIQAFFVRDKVKIKMVIQYILKYFAFGIIMCLFVLSIQNVFTGLIGLTFQILLGASIYILLLWISKDSILGKR